jgi:hypothetical protein
MDTHKNARLTPKGREDMVRAVVHSGLTKAAAARRFTGPWILAVGSCEFEHVRNYDKPLFRTFGCDRPIFRRCMRSRTPATAWICGSQPLRPRPRSKNQRRDLAGSIGSWS